MTQLFTPRERSAFSLAKALSAAAEDNLRGSLEAEMLQEAATRSGRSFAGNGFHLPFELMNRDMTAAGVSGSQNLVGSEMPAALDVLRPFSAILRAGGQVYNLVGNAAVPVTNTASDITWLENESSQIGEAQAVIGQMSLSPKNAGILCEISAQLARQSNIDAFLIRELNRSIGTGLDTAILAGSGTSGQPHGIHATPGIGSQSGTSLAWAGVLAMLESVAEANAESVTWIGTPAVRTLLAQRVRLTGGGKAIWDDGRIEEYPAVALANAPTDTLTAGDFTQVVVGLWADGVDIAVDPYSGFSTGSIMYRAWLSADVGITSRSVFSVATSIT